VSAGHILIFAFGEAFSKSYCFCLVRASFALFVASYFVVLHLGLVMFPFILIVVSPQLPISVVQPLPDDHDQTRSSFLSPGRFHSFSFKTELPCQSQHPAEVTFSSSQRRLGTSRQLGTLPVGTSVDLSPPSPLQTSYGAIYLRLPRCS
jgi:hypothetical protein